MAVLTLGSLAKGGAPVATGPLADAQALVATRPGLRIMRVQGGSMVPFFEDGAVVVVKALPFARLQTGMLVVYRNRFNEIIVHRIVGSAAGGWRAKGQANGRVDSTLVTAGNLIGMVYATFNVVQPESPAKSIVPVALAAPAR